MTIVEFSYVKESIESWPITEEQVESPETKSTAKDNCEQEYSQAQCMAQCLGHEYLFS